MAYVMASAATRATYPVSDFVSSVQDHLHTKNDNGYSRTNSLLTVSSKRSSIF